MTDLRKFVVVGFDDDSIAIIHRSWVLEKQNGDTVCYWPPNCQTVRGRKGEIPDIERWMIYEIRIFSSTDTYEAAIKKSRMALDTSNVETDDEPDESRIRKKPRRFEETDSAEQPDDETTYPNAAMQTPIKKVSKDLPEAPPVQKYVRRSVPQTQSASNRTETASCSYGLSPQGSSFIPIGCISSPGSINNPSPTARSGYGHVVRSSMSPAGSSLSPQLESVGFGLGNSNIPDELPQLTVPRKRTDTLITSEIAEKIFKEIKVIKEDQAEMLRLLRQQTSRNAAGDLIIEDVIEKPCESENQLQHLNTELQNEDFKKKLVILLSTLGSNKLGNSVRKMMRMLGTNTLWSGYSLKGKKNKMAFASLPICSIIKAACMKIHKNVEVNEVEEQIAETLKHAPAQKDGPKYRQRPQGRPQEPAPEEEDMYLN